MIMAVELEKPKTERSLLVPFLAGGVIGAGIALLLAPKSGKELRKDISDVASRTRDKVNETLEQGKNLYVEGRMAVKEAIEAGKHAFVEERERHIKAA
jgi:gas vesicle protein